MATIKLYYDLPSVISNQAIITSLKLRDDGKIDLTLDKTVFYPEAGGQPYDSGTIKGLKVVDVQEHGEEIIHTVEPGLDENGNEVQLSVSQNVLCRLDYDRRLDHSQQHTAQHLLSSVVLRLFNAKTISFHLGVSHSFIDIDATTFDEDRIEQAEDEMMNLIRACHKITCYTCPPSDISSFPLRREPKVHDEIMRVVEIGDFEYSACCGTHLSNTSEIGLFRILKAEKYKRGIRLYFVAGKRAWEEVRRMSRILISTSKLLGIQDEMLCETVQAMKDKVEDTLGKLDEVKTILASYEANEAISNAQNVSKFVFAQTESTDLAIRLSRAIAAKGQASLVACYGDLKVASASPSKSEKSVNVGEVLSSIAKECGGKGGGGPTFFQAAFTERTNFDSFIEKALKA